MGPRSYLIRQTTASDWREVRNLRLEMIRDTPIGFAETYEDALHHDEGEWRRRGLRGTVEHAIVVVAIDDVGRWIGTMGGYIPDQTTGPVLVGVYVAADYRGTAAGVTDALLQSVEDWARTEGNRLTLHVHEDNARARSAYEKRGFRRTGAMFPYLLDPAKLELEMVKEL